MPMLATFPTLYLLIVKNSNDKVGTKTIMPFHHLKPWFCENHGILNDTNSNTNNKDTQQGLFVMIQF